MEYKLPLKEISTDSVEIQGTEMAIVDKESGEVFLTSRKYMDSLFKIAGYENLNVVKILQEYAGKSVSSVGSLDPYKIYVNETTGTFVLATPEMINWIKAMTDFLKVGKFKCSHAKPDIYYIWDQFVVTNPAGGSYAIYVDLYDEAVYVYSAVFEGSVLVGLLSEGKFKFSDGQDSFDRFKLLISGPSHIESLFQKDASLSFYEYIDLLKSLGYVSTKKHKYYSTDRASEIADLVNNLDDILDKYNDLSWLQTRIKKSPNNATFYDGCALISKSLNDRYFSDFKSYYLRNKDESGDLFCLE